MTTVTAIPAIAYRAVVDGAVGPMMDMERVAGRLAAAHLEGQQFVARAMVTWSRERDLTAAEQERLVALITAKITGGNHAA